MLAVLNFSGFGGKLFIFSSQVHFTWSVDEMTLCEARYLHPFQEENCWCDVRVQHLWGGLC